MNERPLTVLFWITSIIVLLWAGFERKLDVNMTTTARMVKYNGTNRVYACLPCELLSHPK